jgi:hypothetical protein
VLCPPHQYCALHTDVTKALPSILWCGMWERKMCLIVKGEKYIYTKVYEEIYGHQHS